MGQLLEFRRLDPIDIAIGARLKHWREQRGMALDEVASALRMTHDEVRRAEAGRAHLDSRQIGAATRCLRLPVWALVSDTRAY